MRRSSTWTEEEGTWLPHTHLSLAASTVLVLQDLLKLQLLLLRLFEGPPHQVAQHLSAQLTHTTRLILGTLIMHAHSIIILGVYWILSPSAHLFTMGEKGCSLPTRWAESRERRVRGRLNSANSSSSSESTAGSMLAASIESLGGLK